MRYYYKLTVAIYAVLLIACDNSKSPVDYVDPFIGTGFHGHTYPGATVPFGAVQLSPDTRKGNWDACAGYHYSDSAIIGFSHTHLSGTGCIDLGDILFHPTYKEANSPSTGGLYNPTTFSHKNEKASAGYYSVKLDNGIKAELTATTHVGVHRYTFDKQSSRTIYIDLAHALEAERIQESEIHFVSPTEVVGMRRTSGWVADQYIYFVAQLSEPIAKYAIIKDNVVMSETDRASGGDLTGEIQFADNGNPIEIKVGVSIVSIENARLNLQQEVGSIGFDQVAQQARERWNTALSKFSVEGGSEVHKKNFYTALYHSMVVPNTISDVNGQYRGADNKIHNLDGGCKNAYSTLSLWDTFRAWHPLMTITDTELTRDIIHSMLNFYEQHGELPIWPLSSGETGTMIGYHSISVIYDAYKKGIRDFDANKALDAMIASANKNSKSAVHFPGMGYIPTDSKRESVSCLLENCYDDWCIAMMARDMGREDDYQDFAKRAMQYKNVFDGGTGFFRGKRADGNWEENFDSYEVGRSYTEATAWQYRFFVPHDVEGMVSMFGGRECLASALDELFSASTDLKGHMSDITGLIGQYAHGNEPSHHIAYLYNYVGQPWKTQQMTRRVLDEMYQPTPEGISGNEDCGQMSAWYVMSSLGIYVVCPGSGEYALTTPLFGKVVISLANGKKLEIAANDPDKNIYIKSVSLNGKTVNRNFITHQELMEGGVLQFELDSKPNLSRGIDTQAYLYSLSQKQEVSPAFVKNDLTFFEKEVTVDMGCATNGVQIRYTTDGSEPTESSTLYDKPFSVDKSQTIRMRAFKDGFEPSIVSQVEAVKTEYRNGLSQITSGKNGVRYVYFEGRYKDVGQMLEVNNVKGTGVNEYTDISIAKQSDFFGFEFSGFIYAPQKGIYEFYTKSDDGSVLFIGDRKVVNNDGSHGAIRASGKIALDKGYHPYRLCYFEDYEGEELEWGWKTPSAQSETQMPRENLFQ